MNEMGRGKAWNLRMNKEILEKQCKNYSIREGRASFYDDAVKIAAAYPLQASIIILAVWNMNRFRFTVNDAKNLIDLRRAIKKVIPKFENLQEKEFRTAKFGEIGGTVKEIYSTLSKVKGVEHTGASKVMHLLNRNLFLIWDSYMRKEYGYHKYSNEDGYLHYLIKMQDKVRNVEWDRCDKTLPKAIDEFNFMKITYPLMRKRKRKRLQKLKKTQNASNSKS